MAYSTTAKNLMLNALTPVAQYISLHDGDPGASGANELAGGSPAYARQQVAWGSATGGSVSLSGTETFNVPAGSTVSHFGLWSAVSGGTFYGGGPLAASEVFASQGEFELQDAELDLNA